MLINVLTTLVWTSPKDRYSRKIRYYGIVIDFDKQTYVSIQTIRPLPCCYGNRKMIFYVHRVDKRIKIY